MFPSGLDQFGIETVANLITLSYDAHGLWNRGTFALKPISINDDQTKLKIQFFWQKGQRDMTTINLLNTPFSTKGLESNDNGTFQHGYTMLFNLETRSPIKSGDIFEFETDDPVQRPLPSFGLLEMQFFLTRVVGMAGAALQFESDWEDEGDGDVSDLGLGDIEDTTISFQDATTPPPLPERLTQGYLLPAEGSKQPQMGAADSFDVQGVQ